MRLAGLLPSQIASCTGTTGFTLFNTGGLPLRLAGQAKPQATFASGRVVNTPGSVLHRDLFRVSPHTLHGGWISLSFYPPEGRPLRLARPAMPWVALVSGRAVESPCIKPLRLAGLRKTNLPLRLAGQRNVSLISFQIESTFLWGVGGLVVEQTPHVQGCCRSGLGSIPACGPLLHVTSPLSPPFTLNCPMN